LLRRLQTNPTVLFVILLLGMLCYMPTWSLTNAIAMANAPSEKFPQIRVFGSIGWVAAAVFSLVASKWFNGLKIDGTAIPLYCGAGTALLAALLNLIAQLPPRPRSRAGRRLRAMTLLKDRNFALFMILSMLVMLPFTMYFSLGSQFFKSQGFEQVTATMNLGQFVEMFVMLLVPMAGAPRGWPRSRAQFAGAVRRIHGRRYAHRLAVLRGDSRTAVYGFFVGGQSRT
jgi:hypothetical protein